MSDPDRARTTPGGAAHPDPAQASDSPVAPDSQPSIELREGVTPDAGEAPSGASHGEASTAQDDASDTSTTPAALPGPIPHAGLRYGLLRLLMLVSVGGILYVIGLRGWLLAFAAVLMSGIVSLFLFMRQRNDAALNLEHSIDHWKHRHTENEETLQ